MWQTQIESLLGVPAIAPVSKPPLPNVQASVCKLAKKAKVVKKRGQYKYSPEREAAALAAFAKSHAKQSARRRANKDMLLKMITEQEMSAPEMMDDSGLSDRYICKVLLEMVDEGTVTYVTRKIGRNHTRFWRAV